MPLYKAWFFSIKIDNTNADLHSLYKDYVVKKLSVSQANSIVGGTCKTCTTKYVASGFKCNMVTTCTDKTGKVISQDSKPTALGNCGIIEK